jgi:hypothetical protein
METREDWLSQAVTELRPLFDNAGRPLPDKIRVTCGFPPTTPGQHTAVPSVSTGPQRTAMTRRMRFWSRPFLMMTLTFLLCWCMSLLTPQPMGMDTVGAFRPGQDAWP